MRYARTTLPLLAALALSGCISFGSKPPPQLMRLQSSAVVQADSSRTATAAQAVTIMPPTVPQELATLRVPVRSGGTAVAYIKDAQWVEAPGTLFARLLAETIGSTGRVVLDPRQFTFDPGVRLTGQLLAFGADADSQQAVVIYDATLARGPNSVETHRFEAHVPLSSIDANTIGPALNQAANQIAGEVVRWIGS